MTRINTYPVQFLSNSHLIAEYRELPRIPNRVASGKPYPNIPETYRMGKGHESFFGDKVDWLHSRHLQILAELQRRTVMYPNRFGGEYAIDIDDTCLEINCIYPDLYQWWEPTKAAHLTNIERVIERMLGAGKMDYYGDHKLDSPSKVWELVIAPLARHLDLYDDISTMFAIAVNNLDTIKADADTRRDEIRVKKAKENK